MEERGFTALKFDPFPGPWREYVDRDELEHAANVVGAVREAVGPSVELLVEVHRRLSPMKAIQVAKMIEKYDPYWFEEPCPPDNIDAIKEVRAGHHHSGRHRRGAIHPQVTSGRCW